VLILVGTEDALQPMATTLHDPLEKAGKPVRMDVYEHGYHDFVLGPQGQKRTDLPRGEVLLQGVHGRLGSAQHVVDQLLAVG
jgi:acetyl esterase/lipase